ncbi:WD40/YVTN/BNR-like repeat-containing protein [Massilia terrae]|uniref:Exo-alpha-sialidase n=1 Tax=Massilia terrae TaxID=1811224 RepID=A0ABT2CTR2_9BURK|nr:exo-alpha-sialidase [Massilia terrae]MCS0657175.1 exo-alpha-sialidase [Massilia terrae]
MKWLCLGWRRCAAGLVAMLALAAPAAVAPAPVAPPTYTWDSVAMGGGGFVSALVPGPPGTGALYARTDVGGAYRWDETHGRWLPLLDWLPEEQAGYLGVDALAVDPANAANIYLLAGTAYLNGGKTAVLRSHDGGASFAVTDVSAQFKTHGNGMGRQNGERLVVDPGSGQVLYAGTRANGLFRSRDAGASWGRVGALDVTTTPDGNGICLLVADPSSVARGAAQRLFVGISRYGSAGANLYRSDDGGASFRAVPGAPGDLMPQRAALDGQGNLYLSYANGAGPHPLRADSMDRGQIWKYAIASGRWSNVTPPGVTAAFSGISVDPANPRRLVASTISLYARQGTANGDRIFVSSDGGASWSDVIARGFAQNNGGVPWIAGKAIHWASTVVFDPRDARSVWVSSGNGVFRTADIEARPATWTFTVKGLEETVPLNIASIPGGALLSAIGDYDGLRHLDTASYGSPIHTPEMGTTTGLAVADRNSRMVARVGRLLYLSADGGASWTQAASKAGKGQLAWSADGAVLLHSPENSSTSYRSADRGAHWTAVTGLAVKNARPLADPVDASRFYVYDPLTGGFWASTDGGGSFSQRNTLASGGASLIRAAPGRPGDVWVALNESGLARSTSAGRQFSKVGGVGYCGAVGFGKAASGAAYPTVFIWGTVGGVRGVFRSTDAGASWLRVNDDAHQYGGPGDGAFVVGDSNAFGVVYMSTAGRGIAVGKP